MTSTGSSAEMKMTSLVLIKIVWKRFKNNLNPKVRPQLCFLARDPQDNTVIGAIVCKLDRHKNIIRRGYIGTGFDIYAIRGNLFTLGFAKQTNQQNGALS